MNTNAPDILNSQMKGWYKHKAKEKRGRSFIHDSSMEEFDDFDESPNWTDTDEFRAAKEQVISYIEQKQVTTFGAIARANPEHTRIIQTILNHLRVDGRVYWDEWRPLPTLIYAGDRRIEDIEYDWHEAKDRTWAQRVQDLGEIT
jgi:alkylated DNA nucleotide flippase Atl1